MNFLLYALLFNSISISLLMEYIIIKEITNNFLSNKIYSLIMIFISISFILLNLGLYQIVKGAIR